MLRWSEKLLNLATKLLGLQQRLLRPTECHKPLWPTAMAAETSAKLLPLATQALTSQSFPPVTSSPCPFQWPPASIANASMRLPPLAVQATQALQDVTKPNPFPWPTAAEGSVRLSPLATQAYTSQAFPPVTNNPIFLFSGLQLPYQILAHRPILNMRLPSLTIAAHAPLPHSSLLHSK